MTRIEALTYELLVELEALSPEDIKQVRTEWMEELKGKGISDRAITFVNTVTDYVLLKACSA